MSWSGSTVSSARGSSSGSSSDTNGAGVLPSKQGPAVPGVGRGAGCPERVLLRDGPPAGAEEAARPGRRGGVPYRRAAALCPDAAVYRIEVADLYASGMGGTSLIRRWWRACLRELTTE